jgi:hypothetical protein
VRIIALLIVIYILLIFLVLAVVPDSILKEYPQMIETTPTIIMIALGVYFFYRKRKYISFGKYKGQKWSDIPEGYLQWMKNTLKGSRRRRATNELKKRESLNSTEITERYSNTVLGIIEAKRQCWKCKKNTKVITLRFYSNISNIELYKNKPAVKYFIRELNHELLTLIQSKYPFFKQKYGKSINDTYIANCCNYCDGIQGDFFLHEEIDSPFLDSYKMKCKNYIVLSDSKMKFSTSAK